MFLVILASVVSDKMLDHFHLFVLLVCLCKMQVQVWYCQQHGCVKVDDVNGQFDFTRFHEKGLFVIFGRQREFCVRDFIQVCLIIQW